MKYTQEFKDFLITTKGSEREVEIPFLLDNIPNPPLRMLDVGCCFTNFIIEMDKLGYDAYGIDMLPYDYHKYLQCDAREIPFSENFFDLVTCISALEHFGLVNTPYNTDQVEDKFADKKAMKEMYRVLKSGGRLILTLPYGIISDGFKVWLKTYDKKSLKALIDDSKFKVIKISYSAKIDSIWKQVDEKTASKVYSDDLIVSNVCLLLEKEEK